MHPERPVNSWKDGQRLYTWVAVTATWWSLFSPMTLKDFFLGAEIYSQIKIYTEAHSLKLMTAEKHAVDSQAGFSPQALVLLRGLCGIVALDDREPHLIRYDLKHPPPVAV